MTPSDRQMLPRCEDEDFGRDPLIRSSTAETRLVGGTGTKRQQLMPVVQPDDRQALFALFG